MSIFQQIVAIDFVEQFERGAQSYLAAKKEYYANHANRALECIKGALDRSPRSARLLDVGCGGGDDFHSYLEMGFCNLFGVDPSKSMVLAASKALPAIKISDGKWEQLNFPDADIDIVVGNFSMQYCENIDRGIDEAVRVLKRGGYFVVAVSHPTFDGVHGQHYSGKNSLVTANLYNGKFSVKYPGHSLSEYLSENFFRNFRLVKLTEFFSAANSRAVPSGLCVVGTKE